MGLLRNVIANGDDTTSGAGKSLLDVGLRGTHSAQVVSRVNDTMRVRILPALSDNYMYLVGKLNHALV